MYSTQPLDMTVSSVSLRLSKANVKMYANKTFYFCFKKRIEFWNIEAVVPLIAPYHWTELGGNINRKSRVKNRHVIRMQRWLTVGPLCTSGRRNRENSSSWSKNKLRRSFALLSKVLSVAWWSYTQYNFEIIKIVEKSHSSNFWSVLLDSPLRVWSNCQYHLLTKKSAERTCIRNLLKFNFQ